MADIDCPICGKSLSCNGLTGHLSMVHDYQKPEDMGQYELAEAIEGGELEIGAEKTELEEEEGSERMKDNTDYLNDLFDSLESRSGYYKQPNREKKSRSDQTKKNDDTGGVGNFFPSAPDLDYFKWGKRLAIAGLVTGGAVYLYKNWEGISDRLQETNETEDQSVNAEDVNNSGKDNGKRKSRSSSKSFARISDL